VWGVKENRQRYPPYSAKLPYVTDHVEANDVNVTGKTVADFLEGLGK
jgi:hypothetical protein